MTGLMVARALLVIALVAVILAIVYYAGKDQGEGPL